jgi:hypothetical protein
MDGGLAKSQWESIVRSCTKSLPVQVVDGSGKGRAFLYRETGAWWTGWSGMAPHSIFQMENSLAWTTENGGGELSWQPRNAKPEVIDKENVIAILRDGDNAVAIFGLAHMSLDYGRAMSLTRKSDGTWATGRLIQLFAEPEAITALGNGRFAVLNAGRVIVFLPGEGILGLAACK